MSSCAKWHLHCKVKLNVICEYNKVFGILGQYLSRHLHWYRSLRSWKMELSFNKFQVICIKMTREFVTTFSVALIFQDLLPQQTGRQCLGFSSACYNFRFGLVGSLRPRQVIKLPSCSSLQTDQPLELWLFILWTAMFICRAKPPKILRLISKNNWIKMQYIQTFAQIV